MYTWCCPIIVDTLCCEMTIASWCCAVSFSDHCQLVLWDDHCQLVLCRQVAGLAAGMVSVLLGLVYLSVSLTRPFSFTWGPDSPMTESALPLAGQLVLSLLAPVAFALGVDQVNDHAAADRFSHSYPLISRTCATLLWWGTADAEISTDEAGIWSWNYDVTDVRR